MSGKKFFARGIFCKDYNQAARKSSGKCGIAIVMPARTCGGLSNHDFWQGKN